MRWEERCGESEWNQRRRVAFETWNRRRSCREGYLGGIMEQLAHAISVDNLAHACGLQFAHASGLQFAHAFGAGIFAHASGRQFLRMQSAVQFAHRIGGANLRRESGCNLRNQGAFCRAAGGGGIRRHFHVQGVDAESGGILTWRAWTRNQGRF
jgi:hypothetical protein